MKTLYRLLRFLPHKGGFALCGLLLTAEMGSVLLTPYILQELAAGRQAVSSLVPMGLCIPLIALGSLGQNILYQKSIWQLRTSLWKAQLRRPLRQMQAEGEALTLIVDDVDRSMIFLQGFTLASLFRAVVYVTGAILVCRKHPAMLFLAVCLSAVFCISLVLLARKRKKNLAAQRQNMALTSRFLAEMLRGREEIAAFGQEAYFEERYHDLAEELTRKRRRDSALSGLSGAVEFAASMVPQPLALLLGQALMQSEALMQGEILLISGYVAVFVKGWLSLALFWQNSQVSRVRGEQVWRVIHDD